MSELRHSPRGTTVIALVAVVAVAGAMAGAQSAAPGFRVEDQNLDLGRAVAGTTISATFVFRNDSGADVRILRAAPS